MKKLLVALVVGTLLALPMSAMAMDALTQSQLESVEGQAGVSIGFGNSVTIGLSFSSLSLGDPDGVTGAANEGWLIIQSDSADQAAYMNLTIAKGGVMNLDVAYSGDSVVGDGFVNVSGVSIPEQHSFLALSLPAVEIGITLPETLSIGFGTQSGNQACVMMLANLGGLTVDVSTISNLYLWCHD